MGHDLRFVKMYKRTVFLVLLASAIVTTDPVCRRGQYYDMHARMCEFCSIICQHAEIQGTVEKCGENCPGYVVTTSSETVSSPRTTSSSSRSPSLPSSSSPGCLPWQAALLTLTSMLITCCVTALVVIHRESVMRCIGRTLNRCYHGNHTLHPVEEGAEGSEYSMVAERE